MMAAVKVLMLAQSPVEGDSRVLRQAAALAEGGHAVHIIGREVPDGFEAGPSVTVESAARGSGLRRGRGARYAGPVSRGTVATGELPRAAGVVTAGRRLARWLLLPEHRRRTERQWRVDVTRRLAASMPYDVVHAHDFNTLELGVRLAESWSAALVYDSHELWFDRSLPGRPTPLWRARGRRRESRLARRARTVFTVSDGIARRLRDRGLPDVRVVRNTFPRRNQPPRSPERPTGVVYAGRIAAGRDIETVAAAACRLTPLRTVLMGSADPGFHFDRRSVETADATSIDGVDQILREFGIALVTLTDGCENHRLALPNKLFHAVRAGVPVVAADLPELRAMVTGHRLGALYRPGDLSALVDAVRAVIADYPSRLADVRAAAEELTWEHDARTVVSCYEELDARRRAR